MKTSLLVITLLLTILSSTNAQSNPLKKINFLLGTWNGEASGFGNAKGKSQTTYNLVMNGQYIEVQNHTTFIPTEKNPNGEIHEDRGYFSYDKARLALVYRQFNNEGYYNQYILNDTLSSDSLLVFETEFIENFVPNGKAIWKIQIKNENEYETEFNVSFGKGYSCLGRNHMVRK